MKSSFYLFILLLISINSFSGVIGNGSGVVTLENKEVVPADLHIALEATKIPKDFISYKLKDNLSVLNELTSMIKLLNLYNYGKYFLKAATGEATIDGSKWNRDISVEEFDVYLVDELSSKEIIKVRPGLIFDPAAFTYIARLEDWKIKIHFEYI